MPEEIGIDENAPEEPREPHLSRIEDYPPKVEEKALAIQDKLEKLLTKTKEDQITSLVAIRPIIDRANNLFQQLAPISESTVLAYSWFTPEAIEHLRGIKTINDSLPDSDDPETWGPILFFREDALSKLEKLNSETPSSQALLIHTSRHYGEILMSGCLSSRKAQIEASGKANFATGEAKPMETGELNPVYFYRDSRINHGVRFVFSERSLLGQGYQMAESADGVAYYSPDFESNVPQKEGFSVDLTEEPFLILVDPNEQGLGGKKISETLLIFLREKVATSERWRRKISDIDVWIEQHLCFMNNSEVNTPEGMAKIRERLFPALKIPELNRGVFVPSGQSDLENSYVRGPLYKFHQIPS